jgi:hypothetical protein
MDTDTGSKRMPVQLENARQRRRLERGGTRVSARPVGLLPSSWKDTFVEHYEQIRRSLARQRKVGLLCFVSGTGVCGAGLQLAEHWLSVEQGGVGAVIAGRHPEVDIPLVDDDAIASRQLAVIFARDGHGLRYRVVDLQTSLGLRDERGERLESFEAVGPTFVGCGMRLLMFFPTGPAFGQSVELPADPHSGWETLPPRVFEQVEHGNESSRQPKLVEMYRRSRPLTLVRTRGGPRLLKIQLGAETSIAGKFELATSSERLAIGVDEAALERGVLFGRSSRCLTGGLSLTSTDCISRVHLLVIRAGGHLLAIDSASSNGTRDSSGESRRLFELEEGERLTLAEKVTLRWLRSGR